jgi:hypothetical protein
MVLFILYSLLISIFILLYISSFISIRFILVLYFYTFRSEISNIISLLKYSPL